MKTRNWLMPILGLTFAGACLAQTADPARFFKLDYVVKEVEGGKAVNSRSFSTMLAIPVPGRDSQPSSIRAGGRVQIASASGTSSYDLGVNIDSRELREAQGDVSLYISADISTIAQENPGATPVLRQNRWSGTVLVAAKKPTIVFASDDMSSKRQLQLELTATPIK
jgi:hypothetical protein